MIQEEKSLLLQDICARLPYGVVIHLVEPNEDEELYCLNIPQEGLYTRSLEHNNVTTLSPIEDVKPYLRPMSSMTEEECDMVEEILGDKCIFDFMSNGDIVLKQGQFSQNKLAKLCDYYASIHVDYRDLIQMGLALEAPDGMYKKT